MPSMLLLALLGYSSPDISIYDSKNNPKMSWILVNDCAVEVLKADFKDNPDKIVQEVNEQCNLNLRTIHEK